MDAGNVKKVKDKKINIKDNSFMKKTTRFTKKGLIGFVLFCIFTSIFFIVYNAQSDKFNEIYDNDSSISSENSKFNSATKKAYILGKSKLDIIRFCGVKGISKLSLPNNPVFDVNLTIEKGRFKVVLVQYDSVYIIIDKTYKGLIQLDLPSGDYVLKIVGQDAKFQLEISFEEFVYNTKFQWTWPL